MPTELKEGRTERVVLCSGQPTMDSTVKALLFGQLLRRAIDNGIESYLSDLYHDALFVAALLEPCTFYFSTRNTGTWIGRELDFMQHELDNGDPTYRIELTRERLDRWVASFTAIERTGD